MILSRRTQALGQGPGETTSEGARQLGRISRKKRSIDSNLPPSSEEWIGVAHEVIVPLILPWPSSRLQLLGIIETIPPRVSNLKPCRLGILETSRLRKFKLRTNPHTPRTHIPRVARMARPLTRKLGRRRREEETTLRRTGVGLKRLWFRPNPQGQCPNITSTSSGVLKDLRHCLLPP